MRWDAIYDRRFMEPLPTQGVEIGRWKAPNGDIVVEYMTGSWGVVPNEVTQLQEDRPPAPAPPVEPGRP